MTLYGPRHAKGQKKKRDLERKVLAHLKKFGPSLYDALSLRFNTNHSAEIDPILRGLIGEVTGQAREKVSKRRQREIASLVHYASQKWGGLWS